jgi:hypothetical protein
MADEPSGCDMLEHRTLRYPVRMEAVIACIYSCTKILRYLGHGRGMRPEERCIGCKKLLDESMQLDRVFGVVGTPECDL